MPDRATWIAEKDMDDSLLTTAEIRAKLLGVEAETNATIRTASLGLCPKILMREFYERRGAIEQSHA